jgi:YD repeat-containing protein
VIVKTSDTFTKSSHPSKAARPTLRILLIALLLLLVCISTASASVCSGATACSVDLDDRTSNLDCVVEIPGAHVTLQGELSISVRIRGGETSRFSYDAAGRLVSAGAGGGTTSYAHDDAGRVLRSATSDGETASYEYDAVGRVTSARGWRFTYSDQGAVRMIAPDGSMTDYAYDRDAGVTEFYAGESSVRIVYGEQQRVVRIDASGETTAYDYDQEGKPTRRTSAGAVVDYSYDGLGNLIRSAAHSGEIVEYDYDGRSLLRIVDGARTTRFSYDQSGRLAQAVDSEGGVTQFAYDADGHLVSVLPAVGDEVTVSFAQGDLRRPYVVGFLWSDSRPDRFELSDRGRLRSCSLCP